MSVRSRSNWNSDLLDFKERAKRGYLEKNLSEQGREPTTNSTLIWRRRQDGGRGFPTSAAIEHYPNSFDWKQKKNKNRRISQLFNTLPSNCRRLAT